MMRFYPRVGHCWEVEERECEDNRASDGFAVDEADHALHGCHGDNASTGGARHQKEAGDPPLQSPGGIPAFSSPLTAEEDRQRDDPSDHYNGHDSAQDVPQEQRVHRASPPRKIPLPVEADRGTTVPALAPELVLHVLGDLGLLGDHQVGSVSLPRILLRIRRAIVAGCLRP